MNVDVRGDVLALELRRITRTEVRPGVWEISGWFDGATFPMTRREWRCPLCQTPIDARNGAPMVKGEIWSAVAPRGGIMCSDCLIKRCHVFGVTGHSGDRLTLADLIPCMLSLEWVLRHRPVWTGLKGFRDFVTAVVGTLTDLPSIPAVASMGSRDPRPEGAPRHEITDALNLSDRIGR